LKTKIAAHVKTQKYAVNQYLVESILAATRAGEIAIPEIQRPFVWDASRVRDLMDSLYQGYPVGYLIAWRNPDVRTKDGRTALGKKILIDGQQRVTALRTALLGESVLTKEYRTTRITIAFQPQQERFEVSNPAIRKDATWIPDIAPIVGGQTSLLKAHREYLAANPSADQDALERSLTNLTDIAKRQVGLIELQHDLDIEVVTEIFIRINSQGVVLSQADFAMSKIAAAEEYEGPDLRKTIDYFCHLAIAPEIFQNLTANDSAFFETDGGRAVQWLKDEVDELYDPSYIDVLRVAFMAEFQRGRLADLVSLLSGRNFETKTYDEAIARDSFQRLKKSVLRFASENDFKRFLMIIRSAGFIRPDMIRSRNALNFAYAIYLKLREKSDSPASIESVVRRWFVMSVLTGRASGSFETRFESDIRAVSARDAAEVLATVEAGEMSEAFWDVALVEQLRSSTTNSPVFWVYVAAQIKAADRGFLSKDITVRDLVDLRGDIHHVFPKDHLKKLGSKRAEYNQLANFVYMQTEINIQVANKAPSMYFGELLEQCNGGAKRYGNLTSRRDLEANLASHALPVEILNDAPMSYEQFLEVRRQKMAAKIRDYFRSL
jgi:hypothetical protein